MAEKPVIWPIAKLLVAIGNALTPGKGFKDGPFASAEDLRDLVDQAEEADVIEDEERQMIHSVFELGDTVAREVMVPRTDMVWIEKGKTLRQAISLSLRSGYSRIPVIGEDSDDIIGVVYLKDISRRIFENSEAERTELVEKLMRSAYFVPDSKPADELLRRLSRYEEGFYHLDELIPVLHQMKLNHLHHLLYTGRGQCTFLGLKNFQKT